MCNICGGSVSPLVPYKLTIFCVHVCVATAVSGGGGSHWKYERILTVAMVGLIPAGLLYPNPVVDYSLAVALPMHGHW